MLTERFVEALKQRLPDLNVVRVSTPIDSAGRWSLRTCRADHIEEGTSEEVSDQSIEVLLSEMEAEIAKFPTVSTLYFHSLSFDTLADGHGVKKQFKYRFDVAS